MSETEKTLVDNASDAEQVEKAAKTVKARAERDVNDMRKLLAEPWGRRVFKRILDTTRVHDDLGFESPGLQQYVAGQQSIGKRMMLALNEADPDAYGKMIKEARNG